MIQPAEVEFGCARRRSIALCQCVPADAVLPARFRCGCAGLCVVWCKCELTVWACWLGVPIRLLIRGVGRTLSFPHLSILKGLEGSISKCVAGVDAVL